MSIKKNAIANFAGQVYTTLIGIVILPFYLELLGAEAFGLVGFFTLLQSWLALLTAGVAPTLARQVAFYLGRDELAGRQFREVLRSFELIVLLIGFVTALLVWLGSGWLATQWLTVKTLVFDDVAYCITLMGVMVGLRWGVALYSSGINGLERQIWLNSFNIGVASLRYGAAYILLRWVSQDVVHYFEFQLVVSLLELVLIAWRFYASQPVGSCEHDPGFAFSWPAVRGVLPFAMGVTYTSMLWVFMTQSDKLILSHVLSLEEYGYFGLVVLIANGVLRFSEPINQAVLPRLTMLHSRGDTMAMLKLYRTTTQYLVVVVFSVAGVLAFFSQPLLFALTNSQTAAAWGAPVLTWFALGNGLLVVVGMQYTLQFIHGQVHMHVINTTINAFVQVPILAFVAFNYGAVAVAMAWFCIRLATFFIWPAIVHHKFVPGLHMQWMRFDVLSPFLAVVLVMVAAKSVLWVYPLMQVERLLIFLSLLIVGLISLAAGGAASGMIRTDFMIFARKVRRMFGATI